MKTNQNADSSAVRFEATRILAHRLWEKAGCPTGNDLTFWHAAEQQLLEASNTNPGPNRNGSAKRRTQPSAAKSAKSAKSR